MTLAAFFSLTAGSLLLALVTRVAVPPATWLAFALLLHATRSMPAGPGLLSLLIAYYVALAIGNRGVFAFSGPPYFGVIAFFSIVMAVPFALDRFLIERLGGVGVTLIFPVAFVAAEYLRSRITPAATWGSIAYTQYGYLPVMQIAALTGIWGITFAITWFASTAEWAWSRHFEWSTVRVPLLTCLSVVGGLVLAGAVRVALAGIDASALRVATLNRPVDLFVPGEMTRITEGRVPADEVAQVRSKLNQLHTWFLDGSRREARAGARLIAWPAKRLAAEEKVYLAIGIGREASIMQPGDGLVPVVTTPLGRVASAICFDADFPGFMRQAGQGRADLMIVVANEWKSIKDLHVQMAAFRAIENGVPIIRPAASGISSAIDPWGRMLAVGDFFAPGDRTMTAQVPIGRAWTLYPRIGDLFAWSCVIALVAGMGLAVIGRATTSVGVAHNSQLHADVSK